MFCIKCGQEIDSEAKFCIKCGSQQAVVENVPILNSNSIIQQNVTADPAQNEKLRGMTIVAIISVTIGIILYFAIQFFGIANAANSYGEIIRERLSWHELRDLSFDTGIILALISLYKQKNKLALIFGIIACAFNASWCLLYIIGINL